MRTFNVTWIGAAMVTWFSTFGVSPA